MYTSIGSRISIIPSSTPIVVEVRIDGITLRTNTRVLPKYLPVTLLIPNRQNLGPNAWKNRSRKPFVLQLEKTEAVSRGISYRQTVSLNISAQEQPPLVFFDALHRQ